jgi:hypothetical protein
MSQLTITIVLEPERTRMLMIDGQTEVMKAVLGPASTSHPRAAATLLESFSSVMAMPFGSIRCCSISPGPCACSLGSARFESPNKRDASSVPFGNLRERFLAARTIQSVAQGNAQPLDFIERIAHPRPHPRWPDRTVADLLEEERPRLLPLPAVMPESDLVHPIVADKTAFVQFDTNAYSVPPQHARTTLTLVASDVEVRLLDATLLVARHTRSWGRHQRIESPEHRAELLAEKRRGKDLKGRDRLQAEVAGIDALFAAWVHAGRNIGSMTARTLQLLNLYGGEILTSAVVEVTARGSHDPGALAVVCDQHRQALHRPLPAPVVFADHVKDRDVIPHDLGGYDE